MNDHLDSPFQDAVEALRKCVDRVHDRDLRWLETRAREELADLCQLFLHEYYNPPA